jgi:hypothetical protein
MGGVAAIVALFLFGRPQHPTTTATPSKESFSSQSKRNTLENMKRISHGTRNSGTGWAVP